MMELSQPEIHAELYGIVDTFWACRTGDGVSMEALKAYTDLTGERLTAGEVRLIRAMDGAASKWISNRIKNDTEPKIDSRPPQSGGKRRR